MLHVWIYVAGGGFPVYPCSQHSAWNKSKQKTTLTC